MLLTLLAMLHLVLTVTIFSVRFLAIEAACLLAEGALFIAVVSPLLIGSWMTSTVQERGRWLRACPDELIWVPLWWAHPAGIVVSTLLILGVTAYAVRAKLHCSARHRATGFRRTHKTDMNSRKPLKRIGIRLHRRPLSMHFFIADRDDSLKRTLHTTRVAFPSGRKPLDAIDAGSAPLSV